MYERSQVCRKGACIALLRRPVPKTHARTEKNEDVTKKKQQQKKRAGTTVNTTRYTPGTGIVTEV